MTRETYTRTTEQTSAAISQSRVEAVRRRSITATGVRLYGDVTIGVAGGLGEADLNELEKAAATALDRKAPYAGEPTRELTRHERAGSSVPSGEEFISQIESLLESLRTEFPGFIFSDTAKRTRTTTKLTNDAGLDLSHEEEIAEVQILFKDRSSANIIDGGVVTEDREFDAESVLGMSRMLLSGYGKSVELPSGRVPIAFATDDDLPIIKLARDLHGLRFGSGGSAFSGKIGEQILSPKLTVYQSRNSSDVLGPFFDVEGTVNPEDRVALIDHGKVARPYTDKKTAARFDLPLTGAASGEYDDVPSLGFPGLTFADSGKTAAELLDGRVAIFVLFAMGGDFTPTGAFGTPVQLAYLYDGESFLGRVPEFRLSGDFYSMYGDGFIGVSSDTLHPASRSKVLLMEMDL